jgi:hypothetical protein
MLRFTEQFVQSVSLLNETVFHRAVFAYQRDIIEHGVFSVVSPWTGDSLVPERCHIANNGDPAHGNIGIAYRLDGSHPIWLLAGSVKDGFPITEAFLPTQGTSLWSLSDAYCEENQRWKTLLQGVEANLEARQRGAIDKQAAAVLLGHPNFAHHLWNELSALHLYCASRAPQAKPLNLRVIYEPLLPVALFTAGTAITVEKVDSFERLVGLQDTLVTRLGSTQIPRALRDKVAGLVDARGEASTASSLFGCSPVIWLSVRLDARTVDNQTEFLHALVSRVASEYPQAGFILDGFSYPNDFGSAIYQQTDGGANEQSTANRTPGADGFLASAMKTREREITGHVEQLQQAFVHSIANPVISVSGLALADALGLASKADYYVCHAGTLQHKVAWIYNTHGFVHSNRTGVQKGAQKWLADQLEGGVAPGMLSQDYVEDLETIRAPNKVQRNRDYHIDDIEAAVEQVIADLRLALANSSSPVAV